MGAESSKVEPNVDVCRFGAKYSKGQWSPSHEEIVWRPQRTWKVLTFNVWFGSFQQQLRYDAIVRILVQEEPDVACFQEVTSTFLDTLKQSQFVAANYVISHTNRHGYGVLILSRGGQFFEHSLPSLMGRSLVAVKCGDLLVATVHLESTEGCAPQRRVQLEHAVQLLTENHASTTILTGGFRALLTMKVISIFAPNGQKMSNYKKLRPI